MTNTNLYLAFYSEAAALLYGTVFYETPEGKEVEVTWVQRILHDDNSYQWPDKIVVGLVTKYARKGRNVSQYW